MATCRLCREDRDLRDSHVLPAFAFRWMRKSAAGGFLRLAGSPNLRTQDGITKRWLCRSCEQLLSRSEKLFADRIFHPYNEESGRSLRYGTWMMHFATSLAWRVANYFMDEGEVEKWGEQSVARYVDACEAWRKVLLHEERHAGPHQQHLLPLDGIASSTMDLPANANRYFMRAIDMDVCHGGGSQYTYAKLGRFVFLGFAHEPFPAHWKGTKVNANAGAVGPREFTLPVQFGDYMLDRARAVAASIASVSARQGDKIDEALRKNADRYVGSDAFKAMMADVNMFGSAAFSRERKKMG